MMLDRYQVREVQGEALRYHVRSKTRADIDHLVDLAELNGRGRCSCEHFSFRLTHEQKFTCEHTKAAQIHLAKKVVSKCLQLEKAAKKESSLARPPKKFTYVKADGSEVGNQEGPPRPVHGTEGSFPWEG